MAALLHRYDHQMLSDEEKQQLQAWLATQPEGGRKRLEKIQQSLQKQPSGTAKYDLRVEEALQHVKNKLNKAPIPLYKRLLPYAAAVILLIIGGFIYQSRYGQTTLQTAKAETKEVYLADGTYVKLEPCSKLTYNKNMGHGDRTVDLEGAAYFHVAKNEQHPFSVQSRQVNVEVLGTSFRLKTYTTDTEASVLVTSGKVRVSAIEKSSRATTLVYGEKAVFAQNSYPKTQALNQQDVAKTVAGIIVYSGEPLRNVIVDLERSYDVHINCQDDLKSRLFFGELNPQDQLSLFLKKLTMTVHATWKQTSNNQYIIKHD